jgi:hypothetical protein
LHDVRGASEEQFDALGGTGKSVLLSASIANNGDVEGENDFTVMFQDVWPSYGVGGGMWGPKAVDQHHS